MPVRTIPIPGTEKDSPRAAYKSAPAAKQSRIDTARADNWVMRVFTFRSVTILTTLLTYSTMASTVTARARINRIPVIVNFPFLYL